MPPTRQVLWHCPSNKHPAVRGPSKPRRENVVRYCLSCSQETGKLVERTAPALEKKRAVKAQASKAKAQTIREREKSKHAEHWTRDGLRLDQEAKRQWRIICKAGGRKKRMPEITLRDKAWAYSGHSKYWLGEIVISLPKDPDACSRERAAQVLLHELCHDYIHHRTETAHDRTYKRFYIKCASKCWPTLEFDRNDGLGAYPLDDVICSALREQKIMR